MTKLSNVNKNYLHQSVRVFGRLDWLNLNYVEIMIISSITRRLINVRKKIRTETV